MVIGACLTGLHPFSPHLVRCILDWKYGRGDDLANGRRIVASAFESDINTLVRRHLQLQLGSATTASLGSWDLIRPFSEALKGLDSDSMPIARIPLTNTFYRRPKVVGHLSATPGLLIDKAPHPFLPGSILQFQRLAMCPPSAVKTVHLPGPFSFFHMVEFDSRITIQLREEIFLEFSRILANELEALKGIGYQIAIIDETALVWAERLGERLEQGMLELEVSALRNLAERTGITKIIHLGGGNASTPLGSTGRSIIEHILEVRDLGIGIDSLFTPFEDISEMDLSRRPVVAELFDGNGYARTASGGLIVEEPHTIAKAVEHWLEIVDGDLWISPTAGMERITHEAAERKMVAMSETLKLVRQQEVV